MKAIAIRKVDGKPGEVYYPLETLDLPIPTAEPEHVVVKLLAASLNHRDLFLRRHLYPGTTFSVPLLADGYGIVTSTPPELSSWRGKRVIICPGRGWASDPSGPEGAYATLGGTMHYPTGTLQEYISLPASEIEEAPAHLDAAAAAALPLCGLTAWRAVVTKARVAQGQNVLITGIGGGVALAALAFAVALGATVYVTSSSAEKIGRAKELGAAAGVDYRAPDWDKQLRALLPAERPYLDAVIDGAGGDVVKRSTSLLKLGGRIVSYGMTLGPKIDFTMQAVLKNIDVLGSTMGSRREFKEMVKFVGEKGIKPVVHKVVDGLGEEGIDGLFADMDRGAQFGKLVVRIAEDVETAKL